MYSHHNLCLALDKTFEKVAASPVIYFSKEVVCSGSVRECLRCCLWPGWTLEQLDYNAGIHDWKCNFHGPTAFRSQQIAILFALFPLNSGKSTYEHFDILTFWISAKEQVRGFWAYLVLESRIMYSTGVKSNVRNAGWLLAVSCIQFSIWKTVNQKVSELHSRYK